MSERCELVEEVLCAPICESSSRSAVAAVDLTFRYPRSSPVFRSLSIEFSAAKLTVVAGESGCGKTTLLYTIGLLQQPTKGSIHILGRDATSLTDRERSRLRNKTFGFVFQDAQLDRSRSILDNVLESAVYAGQHRTKLTERAMLLLYELGVQVPPKRKASGISGGQAQRVALSRALMLEPPVLLADEPTGNLDPVAASAVMSRLRNEADSGKAVIIVSHDPAVIEAADRVIQLDNQ